MTIKKPALAVSGIAALAAFSYWQNNGIQTSQYTMESKKVPPAFDGFRIVQISDLHDKTFGYQQKRLYHALRTAAPDLIVITGDLCDCKVDTALSVVRGAVELAPVCYVSGNHEARSKVYHRLRRELRSLGVFLLDGRKLTIHRNGGRLCIYGAPDPAFFRKRTLKRDTPECVAKFVQVLGQAFCQKDPREFHILLSHRPEQFDCYAQNGFDLVFCGHAHGGQFRFPGIPGLYAPEQGIFPRYTAGLYRQGTCTMAVSRGLGPSTFPQRLGNRPELVCVTLKSRRLNFHGNF